MFFGEEKMRTRELSNLYGFIFFSKLPFLGHILKKFNTFILWCAVIPLAWSTFGLHLVRGLNSQCKKILLIFV